MKIRVSIPGTYIMAEMPEFDITCHRCGAPVAVEWNEKKKVYEMIQEERRCV